MNPFDLYALEAALRLKEERGGSVSVISMGPPQAEAVIREAYMMGADRGYLLTDRALCRGRHSGHRIYPSPRHRQNR